MCLIAVLWLGAAAGAPAQSRNALVIGNAMYPGANQLENPLRDANAIAATLAELGFRVELRHDLTSLEMRGVIERFYERARDAEGTFFYFAGHGKQVLGVNVLLPIDVPLVRGGVPRKAREILDSALPLDVVVERSGVGSRKWNVIVVDACRNQIVAGRSIGMATGFGPVAAPYGTIVAFSTAPGSLARDGAPGANGLYTRHLLRHLPTPGLEIEQMFKRVRGDVVADSADGAAAQVPWESTSLIGELRLRAPPAPAAAR